MFEEFFGLRVKPFGKTPDPSYLFESDQHKEALARLEYAVEEKELALLVGDIGSGKTTLSRVLIERIGLRYALGPLTQQETFDYIEHRIRIAGGTRNPFSREAMIEIHALSGGIPRLINTLATTALLDAFGEDAPTIDPARVDAAAREHRMSTEHAHG